VRLVRRLPLLLVIPLLASCGGGSSVEPACCPPSDTSTSPSHSGGPTRPFVPHVARAVVAPWHLAEASGRQAVVPVGPRSVLLAGGLLVGDQSTDHVFRISLAAGRVRSSGTLAVPVHDTAGGVVGGLPTVVGGGNATEQSVVQAFDGDAWSLAGNLPTTRSDLSVVEWQGRSFVIGGYDGVHVPREILELRPSGSMRGAGSLVAGVRYAATARAGDTAYVFGGEVLGHELDAVQAVDLRTGRTRVVARLPVPVGHAMAATVGSRILLMGGRVTPDRQTAAMWWFDPASGRFTRAGTLPQPLSDAGVASYAHRVWLLGGEDPTVTDQVVTVTVR
jgi:Kelch motif